MDIEAYSRHLHFYDNEIPELLGPLIGVADCQWVLDVGCGDGRILQALQAAGQLEHRNVWATDLSKNRIDRVKRSLPRINALVRDACDLRDLPENKFDLIMSTQVIEYVSDDGVMLSEISRLAKKGGKLYLTTVFKKKYAWYFYRNSGHWVLDPTHVREYTQEADLLNLVKMNGFQVVRNQKSLFAFPLSDFFARRLGGSLKFYRHQFLRQVRVFKIPIPGYYVWELVAEKKK